MSKFNPFPKPLKGGNQLLSDLLDFDISDILNSGIEIGNVNITGGTIDGVIIGGSNPQDAYFSNIFVQNNTSTNSISNLNSITFNQGSTITESSNSIILDAINNVTVDTTFNVNGNTTISGDLTVIGTIFGVPVAPPIGMTLERLSTSLGTPVNCSDILNITFLHFTGAGTSTGTLNTSIINGFYKIITVVNLPIGGEYHLTITNLLDPGSGVISNKIVKFKYAGQGAILIYSQVDNCYTLLPGGISG